MKRYKDATALRRALETRLKQESESTGGDLGRLRRRVVFDRLAVRLSVDDGTQWILKGGAALEFRLRGRARATKDLDLAARVTEALSQVVEPPAPGSQGRSGAGHTEW